MNILLKAFQDDAVAEMLTELRNASREATGGRPQAIVLASPTGSGKTVMATAVIETLIQGNELLQPDREATFLWLSDQPELNEQTRRKMLAASTVLGPHELVVIDATFDEEVFRPGAVHFLNIQKLGRDTRLIVPGDERAFTIWETISNTVQARPGRFYLFIDEAHRGMAETTRVRNEATTIVQKFIKGSPGEIPPVPLIAGISATPERFTTLLQGVRRTTRQVIVDPEQVRASGLLKESITIFHPREDQPSDMTMLQAAARSWLDYRQQWQAYCDTENEPPVRPLLVVQVQDTSDRRPSRTNLDEAVRVIQDVTGPLPTEAFAHAFQEGHQLLLGTTELRYLSPPDIDQDPNVQVIFFKTSLNTGWDCPRAEVMMSFRTAIDATLIAQLIGRMVRTPLARRIEANEHLNTVSLYLPHYDRDALDKVIARLKSPDPDLMPPVEANEGETVVTLHRGPSTDQMFAALADLPSYTVPRPRRTSDVSRLMKLARLLANDDFVADAPEQAVSKLLATLRRVYDLARDTDRFCTIVEEKGKLEIAAVVLRHGGEVDDDAETVLLDISKENIDDLFDTAGRKLGEGLHKAWWKSRRAEGVMDNAVIKLELFALATDSAVLKALQDTARAVIQTWWTEHRLTIGRLPEAQREKYREVQRLAADPEIVTITYPETIQVTRGNAALDRHLYVDGDGRYPVALNTWESRVITEELARPDVIAWLRNPDRKDWSFCVPYDGPDGDRPLYPDFLIIRSVAGELVVDILDPHRPSLDDAPTKARGLAKFAAKHADRFGRIETIIIEDDQVKRLNLCDDYIRENVLGVQTTQHLRQLFSAG